MILIPLLIVVALGVMATSAQKKGSEKQREDLIKTSVAKVTKGDIAIRVVETGSLEALTTVEVKSQVGGRVAKLMVDEGDFVEKGDLIAVIDPQQTELQVQQNQAQLQGANSSVRRLDVEIAQRRVTAKTNLERTKLQVKQLERDMSAQPAITNATIKSAETGYTSAQKSYDLLVKVTQPNQKTQSEIAVQDAENNQRQAQVEKDRQQGLYEKGYVSKREVEQANLNLQLANTKVRQAKEALQRLDNEQRLDREQSQYRVSQAKSELDRARANAITDPNRKTAYQSALQNVRDAEAALKDVDSLLEQKRGSQANVSQIQSSLNDSLRLLGETEVRAPISGIVTRRLVQMGELVNALSSFSAGSPIVKIEDRSKMYVKLEINEIDVARLTNGMPATITVDALPNMKFTGNVTKISPAQIENAAAVGGDPVVKYLVEVTLDRVDKVLKSGMSGKCEMTPLKGTDVLRLPLAFIGEEKDGTTYAMVYDPNEKLKPAKLGEKPSFEGKRVAIKVGIKDLAYAEILSGLKEGDEVVKPPFNGPQRKGMMQFGPDGDEEEQKTDEGSSSSSSTTEKSASDTKTEKK
ncbi:MAG: efflux RND transporter periplasmic adaptor subunit [Fimbriimonadaceae bacterium]